MIHYNVLCIYMLVVLAYNGTPGPVIMLVTGTKISHSFKHTLKTILGANLGSTTLMIVAVFSMLGLINISNNILEILKILGSIYLFYISGKSFIFIANIVYHKKLHENTKFHYFSGGFQQGYSIGVSNPKDIIFFISLFPQFMNVTSTTSFSIFVLCFIWVLFDWIILLTYSAIASRVIPKILEVYFIFITSFFIFFIALYGIKDFINYVINY